PSPTSTRFFIVSTNKSWETRVYNVVNENTRVCRQLVSNMGKINPNHTAKLRSAKAAVRAHLNSQLGRHQPDGNQLNQATRVAD
ncbi:MAG: hypothetical protein Q9180_007083, partial [Flavoplaca navasiana]